MPKVKRRTKSGIGAFLSVAPSRGGRVQQGAQAKEANASRDERRGEASEARIKELGSTLQTTAARVSSWNNVAQILRDHAATFRANGPDRSTGPDTITAVDDLQAFQIIADEHANGPTTFIPAFEAPPQRRKDAGIVSSPER